LDIKESKVLFFMELLNNFSFVKAQPVTNDLLLQKVDGVTEVNEKIEKSLFLQRLLVCEQTEMLT